MCSLRLPEEKRRLEHLIVSVMSPQRTGAHAHHLISARLSPFRRAAHPLGQNLPSPWRSQSGVAPAQPGSDVTRAYEAYRCHGKILPHNILLCWRRQGVWGFLPLRRHVSAVNAATRSDIDCFHVTTYPLQKQKTGDHPLRPLSFM